jgi:hypothetical protein
LYVYAPPQIQSEKINAGSDKFFDFPEHSEGNSCLKFHNIASNHYFSMYFFFVLKTKAVHGHLRYARMHEHHVM